MRKRKHKLTRREYRALRNMMRSNEEQALKAPISSRAGSNQSSSAMQAMRNSAVKSNIDSGESTRMLPETIYVAQRKANMVHMWTYICMHDHQVTFVNTEGDGPTQLAFFVEEERDTFHAWIDEYMKKFNGKEYLDYPAPTDRHYPYMLERTPKTGMTSAVLKGKSTQEDIQDRWVWCLENALDEVRYFGDCFFFESGEDAALYTLTFA